MTNQNYDWKEKLQQELLQGRLRLALTYVSIILVCYILGMIILMTHYVNQRSMTFYDLYLEAALWIKEIRDNPQVTSTSDNTAGESNPEDGECYSSPGKGVDSPVVYRNCSLEMTAMSSDVQQSGSGSGSSINKDRGGCTDGIVTESAVGNKNWISNLPQRAPVGKPSSVSRHCIGTQVSGDGRPVILSVIIESKDGELSNQNSEATAASILRLTEQPPSEGGKKEPMSISESPPNTNFVTVNAPLAKHKLKEPASKV